MGLERRFEKEMKRALNDMMYTLFPEGYGDNVDPNIEAARIHRAFLEEQKLRDAVSRALQDGVDLGVSVSVTQLSNIGFGFDWTLANVAAREWALRHTNDLLNQLGTTSERVVGQAIGRWVSNGEPLQSLINDLEPVFGQARAERVASTEITRAYAMGTKEAYTASGVVAMIEIRASMDERVCPICGGLAGKRFPLETGAPIYGFPPFHPSCRCWHVAVIDEPKRRR